ncbi:MAG: SDR family oxidoreductase [Acidobacteria bacterium]|nr:MAG: SDR family oxidoreductase [Acidobacteriota bacterium]RPJ77347.1 MAG: SDR family oxidoreductase [Acidobacteriota bacterium]
MEQSAVEAPPGERRELAGKVALVTGGARGLGESICRVLASAGATVVGADIRTELMAKSVEAITAEGGRVRAVAIDVGDAASAEAGIRRIVEEFGKIDILVNNAGTDLTVSIEEMPVSEWDRIIGVNLRGPFILSKLVLPLMRAGGRGHIVNIVSTAAKRAWANASAYHASKWGLLGFTHALHVEGRQVGVKVTAVICGGMRTPFLLDRFPDIDVGTLQDPRNVAETIRFVLSQPEETVIPEVMVLPMRETSWP